MCCDGCSPFTVLDSVWRATTAANYLSVWVLSCLRDVLVTNVRIVAPVSQLFMLQLCHSFMSVRCFQQKKEKKGGKNEGRERDRLREAGLSSDILSGCPGYCALGETTPVIAITLAGRAAHTHTRWTKTASGRHMHSSIRLNSYVNSQKKCRFADVFRKIVPLYFPSLFCSLTLLIKSAAQNKDGTFTLVLIHLMVFKSLPLSPVIVRLFTPANPHPAFMHIHKQTHGLAQG